MGEPYWRDMTSLFSKTDLPAGWVANAGQVREGLYTLEIWASDDLLAGSVRCPVDRRVGPVQFKLRGETEYREVHNVPTAVQLIVSAITKLHHLR